MLSNKKKTAFSINFPYSSAFVLKQCLKNTMASHGISTTASAKIEERITPGRPTLCTNIMFVIRFKITDTYGLKKSALHNPDAS